jgi:hypothetical protein
MQSDACSEFADVSKVEHEVENEEEEISVRNKEENSKEQESLPQMGFVHYIINISSPTELHDSDVLAVM